MAGIQDLSDAELAALAAPKPPKGIEALSDAELQAMAGQHTETGTGSAVMDALAKYGHLQGLGFRTTLGMASGALTGLPTLAVDAGVNAAYGAKKLAHKVAPSLADAPDPKNYYGANPDDSYFPTTAGMAAATEKGLDAVGLPKPENDLERAGMAVGGAVGGALTGAGIGRAISAAPGIVGGVGRFMAAEPGMQAMASGVGAGASSAVDAFDGVNGEGERRFPAFLAPTVGAIAGIGAGTAATAARAATGYIPGVGRIGMNVPDTQMRIAREMVQNRATDARAASRGILAATEREAEPGFTAPGFQGLNYEVARDPGIASMKQAFQDYSAANGAPITVHTAQNNVALTRAWQAQGADFDSANALRAQARDNTAQLDNMGLTRQGQHEPIVISPYLRQLSRESSPLAEGSTDASRAVSRDVRRMVRQGSEWIEQDTGRVRADGTPITRRRLVTDPERLLSNRTDLSESLGAANPNVQYPVPDAVRSRQAAGRNLERMTGLLGSRAPEYPGYVAAQAAIRNEADQQGFLAAQLQRVADKVDDDTGARQFSLPELAKLGNMSKQVRGVAGAPPKMSIGKLSPGRQAFIEAQAENASLNDFSNSRGLTGAGSSTLRRNQVDKEMMTRIDASRAPGERLLGVAARGGGMVLNYLPVVGPKLNAGVRALGSGINQAAGIGARNSQEAIGGILSRFATDRGLANDLLTGPTLPQRSIGISAARQARREGQFFANTILQQQMDEQRRSRSARYR